MHSRLNLETLVREAAERLGPNDVGRANVELHRSIAVEPYEKNGALGAFVLVDPPRQRHRRRRLSAQCSVRRCDGRRTRGRGDWSRCAFVNHRRRYNTHTSTFLKAKQRRRWPVLKRFISSMRNN